MCYATASLGAQLLLDFAWTKTTSGDGCVKEVMGKVVIGVVAGPDVMLCTIWGESEDALCMLRRLRGRRGRALI